MLQKLSPEVTDPQPASSSSAWYQALTLLERLAALRPSVFQHELKMPDNPELAERRLQKWEQQAPFDQDAYFTRRLEEDGCTEDELRYLLGEAPETLQTRVVEVPSPRTLQVALKLGDHLLAHATSLAQGCGWIEERATRPRAGFSHGASGIALSLFALASVSGEERFHKVALSALASERSLFSAQKQNWPDLSGDEASYMTGWCHGAPGMGLARLASLPYHDDAATREEVAIALQTTLADGFRRNHSLCHGSLGNLETVLIASRVLRNW